MRGGAEAGEAWKEEIEGLVGTVLVDGECRERELEGRSDSSMLCPNGF